MHCSVFIVTLQKMLNRDGLTMFRGILPTCCLPADLKLPRCSSERPDCLNADVYNLPCRTHYLFKFDTRNEILRNGCRSQSRLFWMCSVYIFRSITWPCSKTSSGTLWTRNTSCWATVLLVPGLFAIDPSLESSEPSSELDSWALLLPLTSTPSVFKPSGPLSWCFHWNINHPRSKQKQRDIIQIH